MPREAHRATAWGAVLFVAFLPLTATAGAAPLRINEPMDVTGRLEVPQTPRELERGAFLMSGALDFEGSLHGVAVLVEADPVSKMSAPRVRVFDLNDPVSFVQDTPFLDAPNASLSPEANASLMWSVGNGSVQTESPYSFAFLFALERNLPDLGQFAPKRDGAPPPALVADARQAPWQLTSRTNETTHIVPIEGAFVVTTPDGVEQRFEGNEWVVEVQGAVNASWQGKGVAVPLEPDAAATLRPAGGDGFRAGFSVDALERFLASAQRLSTIEVPTGPVVTPPGFAGGEIAFPAQQPATARPNGTGSPTPTTTATPPAGPLGAFAETIEQLGAILNGALFGQLDAELEIEGVFEERPGFTLLRFTELRLSEPTARDVRVDGASALTYTGGRVVHEEDVVKAGPFVFTILAVALYVVGIAATAISRVWTWRPRQEQTDPRMVLGGRVAGAVAAVGAMVLFDREVHFVLGDSLLGAIGIWGEPSAAFMASGVQAAALPPFVLILVVEALLWAAVAFLYAVPVTLIGAALMRMSGFRRAAFGYAAALGAIAAWLLGAPLVRPFLDGVFSTVMGGA